MERLTENYLGCNQIKGCSNGTCEEICKEVLDCGVCPISKAIDKLAEYEQAEEDGLLIRLPCKVGDRVYLLFEKRIYEGVGVKIVSVGTPSHDYTRIEIVFEIEDPWYSDGRKMKHGANEILGEKVFLTKAEAEQALAKMKGV